MTTYDTMNAISEISFIAGTDKVLTFNTFEVDGVTPLSMAGATILWYLCPFGEFTINTLTKSGVPMTTPTTYGFTITLDATDTIFLSGKYIQQCIVTDSTGNTFRPGQGIVIILPAINSA